MRWVRDSVLWLGLDGNVMTWQAYFNACFSLSGMTA
jgi:hypothetical protein